MPRIERYTITIPQNATAFIPSDATTRFEEVKAKKTKGKTAQNNRISIHSQPDQVCIGRACSCKKRHAEMGKNPTDEYVGLRPCGSGYRNIGRKPRYKDHVGRLGKSGELRAVHKRPTHYYDFL